MISVEEKLGVFRQYLMKKQREWGKQTINAAKDDSMEIERAAKIKMKEEKHAIEERNYHVIYRDKNKIIAQGKNAAKTAELEERSRIFSDFNKTILAEAENYVDTAIYREYLRNCIAHIPTVLKTHKEIRILINNRDRDCVEKAASEFLSDYVIEYDSLPKDSIGGIIVRDKENRINCDYTVENLIQENRKLVGMRLNEIMEKQVD